MGMDDLRSFGFACVPECGPDGVCVDVWCMEMTEAEEGSVVD
jgi:hypothetical protein